MEIGQPWYLPWVQDGSLGVGMDIPTSVPSLVQNGLLGQGLVTGMVESGMVGKSLLPTVVQMAKGAYIPHEMAKNAYLPQEVPKTAYIPQEMAKGTYLPQEMAKGTYLPQEMAKGGYLSQEMCSKAGLVSMPSVVSTQCPNVLPDQSFVQSMSQMEAVPGYSYPAHAPSKAVYNPYTQLYQVEAPKVANTQLYQVEAPKGLYQVEAPKDMYGGKSHLYGYQQINTQQMIPLPGINMSLGQMNPLHQILRPLPNIPPASLITPGVLPTSIKDDLCKSTKRKLDDLDGKTDIKKAKMETKALKAKRPGFTDERYNETSYYNDHKTGLRKVYPYYFTFTTFTKGRWVGERILDVFAREFRAHPAEEYERCIKAGTLTVNYEKVDVDYRLKHNDLLANIVHRHEVPVSSEEIKMIHMDDDLVVVNKPASIPVHPCGRYRHNTVVFILAKEHGLKNLRTIHRLDRLTSGLLLFGRNPRKAREMEQQIRTRQVRKEYVCRVDGHFPEELIQCKEKIEVVSYKIGVCKVSPNGKDCWTDFQRLSYNGTTSVVVCRPHTGRMHQIRVHLQYLGFPVVNDPLYNHTVFGPEKGRGGKIGKTDEQLIQDLISIHNAENWLGLDDEGPSSSVPLFQAVSNKLPPTSSIPFNVSSLPGHDPMDTAQGRSESPDSAVDLASIPSSLDSPPGHFNLDLNVDIGVSCAMPPTSMPTTSAGTMPTTSMPAGIMPTTSMPPGTMPTTSMPAGTMPTTSMPPGTMPTTSMPHGTTRAISEDRTSTATQTGVEEADTSFDRSKLTVDRHCYECHVNYRDPSPKDLVMFLHAIKYCGSDWSFETELPHWARPDWREDQSTNIN